MQRLSCFYHGAIRQSQTRFLLFVLLRFGCLCVPLSDLLVVGKASEHVGVSQKASVFIWQNRNTALIPRPIDIPRCVARILFIRLLGFSILFEVGRDRPAFVQPLVEIGEQGFRIAKRNEVFIGPP